MAGHELVAEVWRSGFLESVHYGSVVALDAAGEPVLRVGQPDAPMFPRSSNKPLQTLAMVRHGLDLDAELLALASASHSGEEFHVDGVRQILARAGLTPEALQCPPDLPIGVAAHRAYLAAGGDETRLHMNCSGKHAAMLATCVINGWPTDNYRDPNHPLQRAIADTVAELAGAPIAATGVDGCGAPLYAIPLTGLARAFSVLASAAPGTLERRVADAIRTHPEWVGGTGPERRDTVLMQRVPGLLAKDGAEAVSAIGLPDGRAVAVKIADGGSRARTVAAVAALRQLGVEGLDDLATEPVLGHAEPVGAVRPAAALVPQPALA
ncbi:MAG: asparaginase [Micromonosporaceae bacterium]